MGCICMKILVVWMCRWRSCLYGLRWCGIDSGGTPNRCDMLKLIELDDPLHRHHFDMSKENVH